MKILLNSVFLCFAMHAAFSQQVFYVDDSNDSGIENGTSSKPFNSITQAVNLANSGDTVKVAAGSYSPFAVVEKKIHLLGAFAGATSTQYQSNQAGDFTSRDFDNSISIIQGDLTQACIYLSIEQQEIPGNAIISGFLLRDGERGISIFGEYSGFVSNISIEDNQFQNNGTENTGQLGGGIGFEGINIVIRRNKFEGNKAGRGAAISRTSGSPENFLITDNLIDGNNGFDDHAGAVYLNGTGTFSNNLVSNNRAANGFTYGWGGGIMLFNYDTTKLITVANNIFHHNIAPSRGGAIFVDEAAKVLLDHNLIYANSNLNQEGGAGIYVDSDFDNHPSVVFIKNCTLANNISGLAEGGALYVQASIVAVENCIFWNNSGDDFHLSPDGQNAASLVINFTLAEEFYSGNGNFSSDPYFVDAPNEDFHVRSNFGHFDALTQDFSLPDSDHSPAIDAGNPISEFDNEPQGNGNRVNLGFYGNTPEASKSSVVQLFENQMITSNSFTFFPNPTSTEIGILNLTKETDYSIENTVGKMIQSGKTTGIISLCNLNKGVYFVTIDNQSTKIIVE